MIAGSSGTIRSVLGPIACAWSGLSDVGTSKASALFPLPLGGFVRS